MDGKLDPSLQSDRAAGKAAKWRLFWAVCCEGLRHRRSVGSGHQLCGNHSLPVMGKNTLGGAAEPREDQRRGQPRTVIGMTWVNLDSSEVGEGIQQSGQYPADS